MGLFLIENSGHGIYFSLLAESGSVMLKSSSFVCRCLCEDAIYGVMKCAESDTNFRRFTGEDDRYCFTIVDESDEVIMHSGMYDSEEEREDAISDVREVAGSSGIEFMEEED